LTTVVLHAYLPDLRFAHFGLVTLPFSGPFSKVFEAIRPLCFAANRPGAILLFLASLADFLCDLRGEKFPEITNLDNRFFGRGALWTPRFSVILSAAAFQAERRISVSSGLAREPNCTTTALSETGAYRPVSRTEKISPAAAPRYCGS
jgi:hypothetical protein